MGKLTGRLAIVTGASREVGIGAAICRALAAEGADLFVTYWAPYDKDVSRRWVCGACCSKRICHSRMRSQREFPRRLPSRSI
ncbi:MAG: hypothetical protein ACXVDG_10245, partial [Tumebacillaceae bacterium]